MAKQPKQNRPVDLRTKSAEQLEQQVLDLRREQFNLRFQRATGQTEGIGRVRTVRRDIARIKTILGEKQRLSPAKA